MTDWFEYVDRIQNAMKAVDKAHAAGVELMENANGGTVKKFHDEMLALSHHLEQMREILAHNDTYTMDEIAEAIARTMGTDHTYHRIQPYDTK